MSVEGGWNGTHLFPGALPKLQVQGRRVVAAQLRLRMDNRKDPKELERENCPFFDPGPRPIRDLFGYYHDKGEKHETD